MAWVETSPGVYSTELGGAEKVYRFFSTLFKPTGREHWGLYCSCTLEFGPSLANRDPATALRDAWKALRQEFPGLAIVPDGLTKKTYVLPDASRVEKWADQTFIVDRTSNPDAVLASYPARDTPSLYFFPKSCQVLFLASHWRIDGLGTCMLMERYFSLLAASTPSPTAKSWINDLHKISPRLEDALGAPIDETPETHALAQQHIADHHKNAVHAGGVPYLGDATTLPGSPVRTFIKFNRDTSSALIAACKKRGISVTSAFYAALANAVLALSREDETPEKYTAVMAVNMRSYLMPPYDSKDHAVQVYVVGRMPMVEHARTFDEKTAQFAAYSKDWFNDEFLRAYRVSTRHHYEVMTQRPPAPPPGAPPPKPPSGVTLSSLGVIEKLLPSEYEGGAVKMTDFHFGVSMMTRQMLLYVWTFDGKMTFSINYNDAYHDATAAKAILEFIRKVLAEEVGVRLEPEVIETNKFDH